MLILGFAVVLVTVSPLLKDGFPHNHDLELYMVWLNQFDVGLRDGQFLPRWVPDVWVGYGSPLFSFNQPLFFYLAEGFHVIGLNLVWSVKAVLILITLAGFVFFYLFSRIWFGRRTGLIAATLYALFPYHLGLIFLRGAFSEYLALALLPLLLFSFSRLGQRGTLWNSFIASVSVALVLLSHNLSVLLYLPLLFFFIIFCSPRSVRSYLRAFGAVVYGFLLSAFFWAPAFFERQHLKLDNLYSGPYDYSRHFISPGELFFSNYWESTDVFYQVSFIASLLIIGALILLLKNIRQKRPGKGIIWFFLIVSLISIFLLFSSSRFIWETASPLKYLQFPWRFLSLVDFSVAFLAGALIWPEVQGVFAWIYRKIKPESQYRFSWISLALICLILLFYSDGLKPPGGYLPEKADEHYTPHQQIVNQLKNSTSLNTFVYKTAIYPRYNDFDKLEQKANQVMIDLYEALKEGRAFHYPEALVTDGSAEVTTISKKSIYQEYNVSSNETARLQIQIFYFPGWKAWLDGQPLPMAHNPDVGLMEFDVPAGEHRLVLEFKDTSIRMVANLISLGSVIALFAFWVINIRKTKSPKQDLGLREM